MLTDIEKISLLVDAFMNDESIIEIGQLPESPELSSESFYLCTENHTVLISVMDWMWIGRKGRKIRKIMDRDIYGPGLALHSDWVKRYCTKYGPRTVIMERDNGTY